jgi:hypothetical protein
VLEALEHKGQVIGQMFARPRGDLVRHSVNVFLFGLGIRNRF